MLNLHRSSISNLQSFILILICHTHILHLYCQLANLHTINSIPLEISRSEKEVRRFHFETKKKNIAFKYRHMEIFWPENILRWGHIFDDCALQLVLPQEIYIPIPIAPPSTKLVVFYSAIQLLGKHFEGEELSGSVCLWRTVTEETFHIRKLLPEV